MRPKPVIGQQLFRLNTGNAARNSPQVLTPVVVTKVGNKYFTAETRGQYVFETQYILENWSQKTDYCVDYVLYASEQEWLDEVESAKLCSVIWKSFEYGRNSKNVSLENLRKIAELIPSTTMS